MFQPRSLLRNVSNVSPLIKQRCFSQRQHFDPLRILFCGADEFSIYSLRALNALRARKPECVASIDVVCRPDKRVGRGLKKVQEVPIKPVAQDLDLPLHQIDTFTGWVPFRSYDLVVAVSFGLLVPARILNGAIYGGLNVHPSLLPDLRGPAPIQHALLKSRTHTGVTLQTMHPTRFDHGKILAQTPRPGIQISQSSTVDSLIDRLGASGAEMLAEAVEKGLFLSSTSIGADHSSDLVEHAPKIMPEDRRIDWGTWTADRLLRYDRVLGKLWDETTYPLCKDSHDPKRVIFDGPWRELLQEEEAQQPRADHVSLHRVHGSKTPVLALQTADGRLLSPISATIQGEQKGKGLAALVAGEQLRKP